ncbi:MAG TPA: YceK/YidQ family lipoprotein [Solimonas sp.]|nr:YceK/YidQ family lipoprotein [Solimonas sp.]
MKVMLVTAAALLLSGCMTVVNKQIPRHWGAEYAGTACDLRYLGETVTDSKAWIFSPLLLIDVPLSLVADTLLLPIDLLSENHEGQRDCALVQW